MTEKNSPGNNLIFMIGLPRSGTTFLQRILDRHEDVHTVPEPWIMLHPVYALRQGGLSSEFDSFLARQALDDFLKTLPHGEEIYLEAIRNFGASLYEKVLENSGKKYFLDKTPRYYHIVPELYQLFPFAKFIFVLRNPLAILSSIFETWFDNKIELLKPQYYLDLVKGPELIMRSIGQLGKRAAVVRYEELVVNPTQVVHDLCAYLSIPYKAEIIEYRAKNGKRLPSPSNKHQSNADPVDEDKWHGKFGDQSGVFQYGKPVADSLEKWVDNLSSSMELLSFSKEYLEVLGSSLISEMGYSFDDLMVTLDTLQARYPERHAESNFASSSFEWQDWQKTGAERESIITQLQAQVSWHETHNASEKQYYEEALASERQHSGETLASERQYYEEALASERQHYEETLASQKQFFEAQINSQSKYIEKMGKIIEGVRVNRIYRLLRRIGGWGWFEKALDDLNR